MKRFAQIRAWAEPVRRPAGLLVLGLALLTPGGLLSDRLERARAGAEPRVDATAEGPVTRLWQERARRREMRVDVREFAQAYAIPVSLAEKIQDAALDADVDPRVAFGLVRAESSFRGSVVSPAGAVGYTQLLPSTARWLVPGTSRRDLFDADTNLRVGFKYLRTLLDKYEGDVKLALTAYNRGPGTVDKVLKRGGNPDNGYAEMILTGKSSRETGHARVWLRRRT